MPDPGSGPIARSMTDLAGWLSTVDISAWVGDPGAGDAPAGGLCAWPVAVLAEQEVRASNQRQPMRLRVRYLLTAGGEAGGAEAARLLDPVLSAAAADASVAVVFEPVPVELWRALGLRPRAALLVDVPAQVERATPRVPLVRGPLTLDGTPMRSLSGRVVGPGDVPLAGIRVEAPVVGASTYTDNGGRFAFGGLPAGDPARLVLVGRGRQFEAEVGTDADAPVLIRCDFEEA
jgi:hypothetical protein